MTVCISNLGLKDPPRLFLGVVSNRNFEHEKIHLTSIESILFLSAFLLLEDLRQL
jgi:hypothetical protein